MEKAVSNATVLILLSKLHRIDLLKNIFTKILIPQIIKKEILQRKEKSTEILLLEKELSKFIGVVEVKKTEDLPLGEGETESISLCLQEKVNIFLSDDKKARKFSRTFDLHTMGTIGILLQNLKKEKITKKEFLQLFERLIEEGYYISTQLYAEIMKLVN